MPRQPRVTAREAIRAVERDGWALERVRGSHHYFLHPTKPGIVIIALHAGIMPPGTTAKIIRQAGLTVEAFIELL